MDHRWFFKDYDKDIGPVDSASFLQYVKEGRIQKDTLVKLNDGAWTAAENIDGLFDDSRESSDDDMHIPNELREMHGRIIICPHCWEKFPIENILYIAQHSELLGDDVVPGEFEHLRFLPTRFTPEGHAIDARGMTCPDMACPNCHLHIPQTVIDLSSLFFSIIGAPASGKSYFLTSMVWALRNRLSSIFNFSFTDADPLVNSVINEYEQQLFLNPHPDEITVVKKTQLTGDLYREIRLNGMNISLPMPFIFKLQPTGNATDHDNSTRNLILYDNAGEHFQPGREEVNQPATRHLVHSNGLIFLFDPSIDAKMRLECTKEDPQIEILADKITNQETLLSEMIKRIRLYSGMKTTDRYEYPLIIAVSKYDLWKDIFPYDLENLTAWSCEDGEFEYKLDVNTLLDVSFHMRRILNDILPSFVSTAESFASQVFFLPTSSFGSSSELDESSGLLGIRPEKINPIWIDVPILMLLASHGYIPVHDTRLDAKQITQYELSEESISFMLPGTDELIQLPKTYLGVTLFAGEPEKSFTLPGELSIDWARYNSNDEDDDFWNLPPTVKTAEMLQK